MITDTAADDDIMFASNAFRSRGIPVLAVAIGEEVDPEELVAIASRPKNVIYVSEGVTSLSKVTPNLVSLISESSDFG